MTIIEASSVGVRSMADGTLRLSVDVEPRNSRDAYTLFMPPGVPLALARLQSAPVEPTPEPAKGGELSKWVAMRSGDPDFQAFIAAQARALLSKADINAALVRALCEVSSRAEIDNDPAARERFNERIRGPWIKRTQLEPTR